MKRVIDFLRSPAGVGLLLVPALAAQLEHAAWMAGRISHDWTGTPDTMDWLYAVALELVIFVYVMNGRKKSGLLFAVISVVVNLCYYWSGEMVFVSRAMASVSLPLAIALDSELIDRLTVGGWKCKECGEVFETQQGLAGHSKKHKKDEA